MYTSTSVKQSAKGALAFIRGQIQCRNASVLHGNVYARRPIQHKPIRTRHIGCRRSFMISSPCSAPGKADSSSNTGSNASKYDELKRTPGQTSSLLDTHVNRAAAGAKLGAGRPGGDGVFYMGIRPGDKELPKGYKNWKELGVGGKVARTGARATSSLVILAGAGLTALLVYALATELGSRNSPTVIYSDVCDLVKEHEGLRQLFPPSSTLKFQTTPQRRNADQRPRHRNRSVPSAVSIDRQGREHLYLNFWIEAKPDTGLTWRNLAYWNILEWNWDVREWDWSAEHARTMATQTRHEIWVKGREMLAFLTGEAAPKGNSKPPLPNQTQSSHIQQQSSIINHSNSKQDERRSTSIWSPLIGLFAALRPTSTALSKAQAQRREPKIFTEGEVHVDLIRDSSNNYTYRYILVDLPNSTGSGSATPTRIFVKRTAGVAEDESVMRFS